MHWYGGSSFHGTINRVGVVWRDPCIDEGIQFQCSRKSRGSHHGNIVDTLYSESFSKSEHDWRPTDRGPNQGSEAEDGNMFTWSQPRKVGISYWESLFKKSETFLLEDRYFLINFINNHQGSSTSENVPSWFFSGNFYSKSKLKLSVWNIFGFEIFLSHFTHHWNE